MKRRPVGYRVLVELQTSDLEKQVNKAGLALPDSYADKHKYATKLAKVIALGSVAFQNLGGEGEVKVGDLVEIAAYSGEDKKEPDSTKIYRVINDEDIHTVVEE